MNYIDVVFDGPPSHESGRFVEVEDPTGKSVSVGEWIDRSNGLWALRIPRSPVGQMMPEHPRFSEIGSALMDKLCREHPEVPWHEYSPQAVIDLLNEPKSTSETVSKPHAHEWQQLPRNVNFCVACGAVEDRRAEGKTAP